MSVPRHDQATSTIEQSPVEIEREIERTRERMSENLEELTGRLQPAALKRQAKEAVADKAQDMVAELSEQARTTAAWLRDLVAQNPLPVAAVTLGALSLLARRRSRRRALGRRAAVTRRGR
jgi:cell division septum initiation protein DivIVA